MGIARKLEEVGQDMGSMPSQDNLMDFLDDPENAQWVNGLVGDIQCAWMDYQVCTPKGLTLNGFDIHFRPHYNKTSITRAVKKL